MTSCSLLNLDVENDDNEKPCDRVNGEPDDCSKPLNKANILKNQTIINQYNRKLAFLKDNEVPSVMSLCGF